MVRVKSSVAGVRVCPRQATAITSSLCVNVQSDNKWGLYKVPFVLGGTNNGISINSNSTTLSGTVYIDDAFVGAQDVQSSESSATVAGEAYFGETGSCSWARTSASFGDFSPTAACPGPTVSFQKIGLWQTTDTNLPEFTINTLPPGQYLLELHVDASGSSSTQHCIRLSDGVNNTRPSCQNLSAAARTLVVSGVFEYQNEGNRTFKVQAKSGTGDVSIRNSASDSSPRLLIKKLSTNDIYSSSCGADCVDTFSAKVSSTGVVSGENIDWINGNCVVSGTSTFTCTHNTSIFTAEPNCQITTRGVSGASTQVTKGSGSSSSQTTYVTTTGNDTLQAQATEISCSKTGADFKLSKTIVGSFNEVVTAPGIAKPKTCHYAFGGAGATLASPTVCSTGTCVEVYDSCNTATPPARIATGVYNPVTFASGTFKPNSPVFCTCRSWEQSAAATRDCNNRFQTAGDTSWSSNSNGGYVSTAYSLTVTATAVDTFIQLVCTGEGE